MIHDATVEVTCDNAQCSETVMVELEYVYQTYSGSSGYYDSSESKIEFELKSYHGWVVAEDGAEGSRHFCCSECSGEDAARND